MGEIDIIKEGMRRAIISLKIREVGDGNEVVSEVMKSESKIVSE